jgi:hypothetical protein
MRAVSDSTSASLDPHELRQGFRNRAMNHAIPKLTPKETMLAAIRKRKWIELEIRGLKISRPKLKERTITTAGIVHHFGNSPSGLREADI